MLLKYRAKLSTQWQYRNREDYGEKTTIDVTGEN